MAWGGKAIGAALPVINRLHGFYHQGSTMHPLDSLFYFSLKIYSLLEGRSDAQLFHPLLFTLLQEEEVLWPLSQPLQLPGGLLAVR